MNEYLMTVYRGIDSSVESIQELIAEQRQVVEALKSHQEHTRSALITLGTRLSDAAADLPPNADLIAGIELLKSIINEHMSREEEDAQGDTVILGPDES